MVDFLLHADCYHGIFPHFMNGATGKTIAFGRLDDGADIVETSYLMMGCSLPVNILIMIPQLKNISAIALDGSGKQPISTGMLHGVIQCFTGIGVLPTVLT